MLATTLSRPAVKRPSLRGVYPQSLFTALGPAWGGGPCGRVCARIMAMILWGSIREFPLFSVLQFLSVQRRTGILEIQDFEEHGCIYLSNGRIEAITTPASDEALGARLVAGGFLAAKQVKESWMESSQEDSAHPVMASLLALAVGEPEDLVSIVDRHTADQVMQLMYWNTGTFRLTVPAKAVRFPVVPSLDVENLLLEAYRRVDEGERPRREKIAVEEELCMTCTLDCSPEIKQRYLKPDVCLWRNMPSVMKDPLFRSPRTSAQIIDEGDDGGLEFL